MSDTWSPGSRESATDDPVVGARLARAQQSTDHAALGLVRAKTIGNAVVYGSLV